jgi:hypothetical protein
MSMAFRRGRFWLLVEDRQALVIALPSSLALHHIPVLAYNWPMSSL